MSKFRPTLALLAALAGCAIAHAAEPTLMLHQPTLSRDAIAFVYGGNIWVTDRQGSQPRQLTHDAGSDVQPRFSPDGRFVAYSATVDGNTDVYVIPTAGGAPRRLTWHPGVDMVCGWSADGQRVLFASAREIGNSRASQFYEVPRDGGPEKKLMQAVGVTASWSADGKRLAYMPTGPAWAGASGWRQHRGGDTPPIWIIDPATPAAQQQWDKVPHVNASDTNPRWSGSQVVFISDRADGAANLFAYDTATHALRQLTHEKVWDVRSADVDGDTVVYEVGGRFKTLSLAGGPEQELPVTIGVDGPQTRVQWKDAGKALTRAVLSPTAKRVLVTARGEVFSVPVKDGSVRDLTNTDGVRESDALWSPDGQQIAYLSEAGQGMALHHVLMLRDQAGLDAPRTIALQQPGYYSLLAWSPEGKTLVLADNHLNLYALDIASGALTHVDAAARRLEDQLGERVSFSPDGRYLAYSVIQANYLSQVRVFDLATKQVHDVSDPLVSATAPAFSPKGDLLFFAASTNAGVADASLDMSSNDRPRRAGLYAAVLAADGRSPVAPKAGDEERKPDDKKPDDKKADDKKADDKKATRIDFDGLAERVVALPVAERNYQALAVAGDGALFYLDREQPGASGGKPGTEPASELYRFDFEARKAKSVAEDVADFNLSADGKKLLLLGAHDSLQVGDAGEKPDAKPVELGGLRMRVDPRHEWRQIFDETWWMEREYFYDPKLHGLDAAGVYARYLPLLASVQRREDLNELLVNMIAEFQVGHDRVGGGDVYQPTPVPVGLLGADFAPEQGRLRITRILAGDRFNPFLAAPLAQPGLGVKVGNFLLAVNGVELRGDQGNLFEQLANTVGRQVTLTVADDAAGKNRRQVVVVPVASEAALRHWDWLEHNRRYVDAHSGGRIAYVYMPDTAEDGFNAFNRMFFAQAQKDALLLDERRNGGGQVANYVIETLHRNYLMSAKDRDGLLLDTPTAGIYGPKAMLIDQDAGSGGDIMPYLFRKTGLGPLIGTRTWGGVIGIAVNPSLIDGGALTVPYVRLFSADRHWVVENEGVAPDVEVELDPRAVNAGQDPQLDAAIANITARLKDWQPVRAATPPAIPTELGK
ncbi:MAG: PD40 domain-containing protein [Pelomonas sp.]|nr:PD40 domain-containing protein [Roseateles sp.]